MGRLDALSLRWLLRFALLFTVTSHDFSVSRSLSQKPVQTAEIVSCSGWALNRLPELKSFLKDGEAEQYEGVTVKYVHGRTAVMTIYDGNRKEVKKVDLHVIRSKEALHAVMRENGFVLKNEVAKPPTGAPIMTQIEVDRNLDIVTVLEKTTPKSPSAITMPKYPYFVLPIGTVVVLIFATGRYFGAFGRRRNRRVQ